MTKYNERLDEILQPIIEKAISDGEGVVYEFSTDFDSDIPEVTSKYLKLKNEAKQAITSLIKELVAEAKPAKKDQLAQSTLDDESRCRFYRYGGYNFALDQFEQNLLKALEEV